MSMVLSIYSQKGFREVTLPERGQQALEVLIERELFALDQDLTLSLAQEDGLWVLRTQDGLLSMSGGERPVSVAITDGAHFQVERERYLLSK